MKARSGPIPCLPQVVSCVCAIASQEPIRRENSIRRRDKGRAAVGRGPCTFLSEGYFGFFLLPALGPCRTALRDCPRDRSARTAVTICGVSTLYRTAVRA